MSREGTGEKELLQLRYPIDSVSVSVFLVSFVMHLLGLLSSRSKATTHMVVVTSVFKR